MNEEELAQGVSSELVLSVLRNCPGGSITAIYLSRCRDVAFVDDCLSFPNPSRRQTTTCCHGSSLSRGGDTPPGRVQLHCYDPQMTFILTLKQCGDGLQWHPRPCRRFQVQKVITSAKGSTGRGFLNLVDLCLGLKTPQIPSRIAQLDRWASAPSRLHSTSQPSLLADTEDAGLFSCRLEASSASHLICSCCKNRSWAPPPALHSRRLIGRLVISACILQSAVSPLPSADQWLHSTVGFSRARPIVSMLGHAR
ncbi:predicted protein [Plenodomus lingam JN3]|uniref:Predicted protein n=1 Tax=Leptosphaeria maculans (strain JN3 / isolate v23.1.3 / race Av1-4-5-6-7-8) TaxID=985895 RepID=E4ZY84_LEPMJ|nr:predicted protein [Plenodomus lingam JN3]CBX96329.1 predicted protein [Plenodomus lingam JN3]